MALARPAKRKEDRLELRLERERRELLDAAAKATGTSTSAFVLTHATEAARDILSDRTHYVLPADRWTKFLELLDREEQPMNDLAAFLARRSILEREG